MWVGIISGVVGQPPLIAGLHVDHEDLSVAERWNIATESDLGAVTRPVRIHLLLRSLCQLLPFARGQLKDPQVGLSAFAGQRDDDLRLVRRDWVMHAYARPDERSSWNEFAPAQPAPKSMPRTVKFGMKLSAEAHKSAQVRWVDLTLDGQVIRTE